VPAARVRRLVPGRWPDRRAPVALRGDTRISRGFILFIHPAAAGARLLARLAWTSCIAGRHTNLTWLYPFHSSSFLLRDHFDPGPVESHRMMPYSRDGDAVDACTGVDACLSGLGHMDLRGPSCTSGPKIVTTQIYRVYRVITLTRTEPATTAAPATAVATDRLSHPLPNRCVLPKGRHICI
jgi:hypothetical protein